MRKNEIKSIIDTYVDYDDKSTEIESLHEVQEGTVERTSWRGKKGVKARERGESEGTKYRRWA